MTLRNLAEGSNLLKMRFIVAKYLWNQPSNSENKPWDSADSRNPGNAMYLQSWWLMMLQFSPFPFRQKVHPVLVNGTTRRTHSAVDVVVELTTYRRNDVHLVAIQALLWDLVSNSKPYTKFPKIIVLEHKA